MTQVYKYRAEVGSNWKLFIDAFTEFYHAPILHSKQAVSEESQKLAGYGYEALAYKIDGPHGMVSSWGGMSPPKDLSMVKPIERVLHSGLFGPWDAPSSIDLPPAVNPARHGLGHRLVPVLPELHGAGLVAELVPHVPLLADVVQHAHLRGHAATSCRRGTPGNGSQQELAAVTFKEYSLQDGNTLEATQIDARVARGHPVPARTTRRSCCACCTRRRASTSPSTRAARRPSRRSPAAS